MYYNKISQVFQINFDSFSSRSLLQLSFQISYCLLCLNCSSLNFADGHIFFAIPNLRSPTPWFLLF